MRLLRNLFLALAATLVHAAAFAAFPDKPVHIIIPFIAGGSTDVVFRHLSGELARQLGQPVVIENRPGGAATIGMNAVANATPDGYTLGVATLSFAANPSFLRDRLPFDPRKDFVPIALVARMPLVLTVHPSVPARSVAELIAYARKHPGELNYGSTGIASSGHLGGALFESLAGVRMTHVPYSNSGVLSAVVGGDLQVLVGPVPTSLPFIRSGKLIGLGITSAKRSPMLPEMPTLEEAGIHGLEAYDWSGLMAPRGTPPEVVNKLHQAIAAALQAVSVRQAIQRTGAEVVGSTPQEFAAFIDKELAIWARVAGEVKARH